jgi:flagellar hook-length control protein FliK
MDVTATLAVLTAPAVDQDAADTRDPAVAAAFTAVLAGMMTAAAPLAAPLDDAGGPTAEDRASVGPAPTAPVAASMVAPAPAGGVLAGAAPAVSVAPPSPAAAAPAPAPTTGEPGAPDAGAAPVTDPAKTSPPVPGLSTPPRPHPIAADRSAAPRVATGPSPVAVAVAVEGASALAATAGMGVASDATEGDGGAADEPAAGGTGEVPVPWDAIATAPTEGLTATTSPAAAGAPSGSRMVERAIAAQVVHRLGRLVDDGEGSHELSLQLEPADLGRLELRVRLEAGVVHVHLEAQARGTSDLLRQALPELRAALTEAGLSPGGLDIHDHGGLAGGGGGPGHPDREPAGDAPAERARSMPATRPLPSPVVIGSGATRGVDVLL